MRVPWKSVFKKQGNKWCIIGSLKVAGLTIKSDGKFCFTKDGTATIGGIDLALFIGQDLEIDKDGDITILRGMWS